MTSRVADPDPSGTLVDIWTLNVSESTPFPCLGCLLSGRRYQYYRLACKSVKWPTENDDGFFTAISESARILYQQHFSLEAGQTLSDDINKQEILIVC